VLVLQIACGVLSLILTLIQVGEKASPIVSEVSQKYKSQNLYTVYQGCDAFYQYYSDASCKYWMRIDSVGRVQYATNPNLIVIN
jgi:hypothetical protein